MKNHLSSESFHWINTTHQIRTPKCNVTLDRSNKDMHCEIEAAAARLSSVDRGPTVT